MSEIIQSMRIVKMYCWETAFDNKIRSVRKLGKSSKEKSVF
jgi:hypothetical protein